MYFKLLCYTVLPFIGCSRVVQINPLIKSLIDDVKTRIIKHEVLELQQTHVTMFQLDRSLLKHYCFSGGPWDSNTGCESSLVNRPPGYSEAVVWDETKSCFTGKDYIDSYGESSDICFKEQEMDIQHHVAKELHLNIYNNHFWRHTCTLSWSCSIKRVEVPVFVSYSRNSGHHSVYMDLLNGTRIWLREGLGTLFFSGASSFLISQTPPLKKRKAISRCLLKGKDTECQLDDASGTIYRWESRNNCFGRTCVLNEGFEESDSHTAAEITTVQQLVEQVNMNRLESEYNAIVNENRIRRITEVMIEMIAAVVDIDKHLLGRVINQPVVAHRVGLGLYELRRPDLENLGNTLSLHTYTTNGHSESFGIGNTQFTPIDIWNSTSLVSFNVSNLKIESVVNDTVNANYLASIHMREMMEFLRGGSVKSSSLKDVLEMPSGYLHTLLHLIYGLTAALMVMSVIAIYCGIRFRKSILGG